MSADPWAPPTEPPAWGTARVPWSRRRRTAIAAGVLSGLAVIGAVFAAGLLWLLGSEDLAVDEQRFDLLEQRLSPVLDDLDDVDLPPSVASGSGRATIEPCYADSGDVFQPSAARVWDVPAPLSHRSGPKVTSNTRRAALLIAEQLRDQGWDGGETFTHAGHITLTRASDGHTVTATIDTYGTTVYVSAQDRSVTACT